MTASYLFIDPKTKATRSYTDDDVLKQLEQEKVRMRNQRPSLKLYWMTLMEKDAKSRLYGYPKVEG